MPCHLSQVLWVLEHEYEGCVLCVSAQKRAHFMYECAICTCKFACMQYTVHEFIASFFLLVFLTYVRDVNRLKSALKDRCHHVTLQSTLLEWREISQWSPALFVHDGRIVTRHRDLFVFCDPFIIHLQTVGYVCVCVCVHAGWPLCDWGVGRSQWNPYQ